MQLAEDIVHALKTPDIIALQEIQDNSGSLDNGVTDASLTYQTLMNAILEQGGPVYHYADLPPQDNQDGGQPGGNIRVGFLFNPERVTLLPDSLQRLQGSAFTNARKPLIAEFRFRRKNITVINNHFSSKFGSSPIFGQIQPFINGQEDIRSAQASLVNDFIAT